MSKGRRKLTVSGVIAAFLSLSCAALLAALFYGVMVYQLAGEQKADVQAANGGGVLALSSGTLVGEAVTEETVGGAVCTVLTRTYALEGSIRALAITASPAAYIERLSGPEVQMELITGFVVDGLDAVYARRGTMGMLAAREGDTVYVIESTLDQQGIYELGALARREP